MSTTCRHCSTEVPASRRLMPEPACGYCCTGCEAATSFSDGTSISFTDYDDPAILNSVALLNNEGSREMDVLVEGIRCGACAADIEKRLKSLDHLYAANVNAHNRILTLRWNPEHLTTSRILQAIAEGGYMPRPLPLDVGLSEIRKNDRQAILRLGLAGLGTMQVMMLSLGLYMGSDLGLTGDIRTLLTWASMLLAAPVVLYSGQPFFAGAFRDIQHRRVGMDVPVALAIGAAFTMSVIHTLQGQGGVWFDSACMFVFFLSLGRHMEASGRRRAQQGLRALVASQSNNVTVLEGSQSRTLPADQLQAGMTLQVRPGETFAADGTVLKGRCQVDESLLTGESTPHIRRKGDHVLAGSLNVDQAIEICADKVGADTTRAHLMRLLRRAGDSKPAVTRLADRIAGHFVLAVLAVAAITGLVWAQVDPSRAFEITLAVLVVTCPCALSLATPATLSAGAAALARRGLLITRAHTLETLADITDVVFDKTGTLTDNRLEVAEVQGSALWSDENVLTLAATMERDQNHPIAEALRNFAPRVNKQVDLNTHWQAGRGVKARLRGHDYELGSPGLLLDRDWQPSETHDGLSWIVMTEDRHPIGWIALRSRIRPEAGKTIAALSKAGLQIHLMSGDHNQATAQVAAELGITNVRGQMQPHDKLVAVETLRARGASVLMVGDGLNDAPVLAGADVSVAMQAGAALAQASADAVLLNENLGTLADAHELAKQARNILRQNLAWAIGYNALAVPLAVTGVLTPWMAAIGMSLSSVVVVGNALRLLRSTTSNSPVKRPGRNEHLRESHA